MESSKSSVGSKSSTGYNDNYQLQSYQDNDEIAEVLRSSWIRRLNLRPISQTVINKDDQSSIMPITTVNSTSNTISTDESKTLTPISDGGSALFFRQLLKTHKEKPTSETDQKSFSFPGFGPFQIRTGKDLVNPDKVPTSLGNGDDDDNSDSQVGKRNSGIGDLGQDSNWKLNYNGYSNSCENFSSQSLKEKAQKGEEQDMKNSFQENWFYKNHNQKARLTDEVLVSNENKNLGYLQEKKVCDDDQQRHPVSPFFRYWSTSKKSECFMNPSLKAFGEEDEKQFRKDDHFSDEQWIKYNRLSHGINSSTRIGGIACHESYNDGGGNGAGRIFRDNAVLNRVEIHESTTYPNEIGESHSSLSKMNSSQRAEMVSSIFQACRTGTRKRIPDDEKFVSMKFRKLDNEEK